MTSSNSNTPSDVAQLRKQLGDQNADAVADFVDGRIKVAVDNLRNEVVELVGRQAANIAGAKESGSSEAIASTNEATKSVKAADKAVQAADQSGSPEDFDQAKAKVDQAKDKVAKTESELAIQVADHEKRICALEEGQTGLAATVDGLWVSVRAHAEAIATGNGATTGLRQAGRLTMAAFIIVLAIWLVLVFTPWVGLGSWNIGVGLAAVAAGLAYVWAIMTMEDDITSYSSAQADAGVDIVNQPADAR